jgi:TolB-like protein
MKSKPLKIKLCHQHRLVLINVVVAFLFGVVFSCRGAEEFDSEMSNLVTTTANAIQKAGIKAVTTADFTDLNGNGSNLGLFLADEFATDLVMMNSNFSVVDRANFKRIMEENKFELSGLVDPDTVKKLGKIAGVDAIIIGTVAPFNNKLRLTIKILATETGRIVGAARVDITKTGGIDRLTTETTGSDAVSAKPSADASNARTSNESAESALKVVGLGKGIIATVESVTRGNNGDIVFAVTVENRGDNEAAVYVGTPDPRYTNPGIQTLSASATDDSGTQYGVRTIGGVTDINSYSQSTPLEQFVNENQFVKISPHDSSEITFTFSPNGQVTATPSEMSFVIEMRVVPDLKNRGYFNKVLTLRGLKCE